MAEKLLGPGDGHVVSILTLYSDDPRSNLAEIYGSIL